ncbi:OstA-like protein [Lacinutrix undariae]
MKQFKYLLALLFLGFTTALTFAQTGKRIQIEYTGFIYQDSLTGKDVATFVRDDQQQIHIIHEGVNMWCDKAVYYKKENFIEAFSNVKMKQGDTINMTAKYVEYSGKTQLAYARGDVILTEPQSTLTTDTLFFDRTKQEAFYKSKGKVVRDSSGTITSQRGHYYMTDKKYRFVQDVLLVNPEYTLTTNQLDFYSEDGGAFMYGPSTIKGEASTIYCERGYYNTNNDTGYFIKNSTINYENRVIEGDSLYFNRNTSFASATNNIKVTDTINNSIITGHYAEVFRAKDSVYITKRALAITVQENDSIYLHADKIMVTGKPEHRITRAFYNAKIFKSDISGKADSIHADHKEGLTQLINIKRFDSKDVFAVKRRPILWNMGNQMTGDSIHLISNVVTEELDSLKVFENAFLINKDTTGVVTEGYNQIKGQRLIGLFKENALYKVDIIKNAEKIYYSVNDKGELVGIDKSKSGLISIKIVDNAIDEIRLINQIDGNLYPESKFPKKTRKLRGFDWREDERPTNVEDLFKDDEPLVLPIIKGLEPYVPQEDFFDEDLLKRIEDAHDKTSTTENKADRHTPKPEKIKKTGYKKLSSQKTSDDN